MKKIFWLAIIICGLSFSATADSLKGGQVACLTKDLYDQAITAAVKKDENAWQYLMKNGCFVAKAGLQITVLELNVFSASKVRVYLGDRAVELWTSFENIQRDKK